MQNNMRVGSRIISRLCDLILILVLYSGARDLGPGLCSGPQSVTKQMKWHQLHLQIEWKATLMTVGNECGPQSRPMDCCFLPQEQTKLKESAQIVTEP